jgi:hypothetical protein
LTDSGGVASGAQHPELTCERYWGAVDDRTAAVYIREMNGTKCMHAGVM